MGSKSATRHPRHQRIISDLTKLEELAKSFDNAPLAETLGCLITAHQMAMYGFEFVSVPMNKRRSGLQRRRAATQTSRSSTV